MKKETGILLRKLTLFFGGIYICGLVGIAGYNIITGRNTYFNQKRTINAAMAKVNQQKTDQKQKVNSGDTKDKPANDPNANQGNANAGTNNNAAPNPAPNPTPNTTPDNTAKEEDYTGVKFERVLNEGMQGEDVKKLQYLLKKKGYYAGDITGKFDNSTTKALTKYQLDKRLAPADGVLGKVTWGTLTE